MGTVGALLQMQTCMSMIADAPSGQIVLLATAAANADTPEVAVGGILSGTSSADTDTAALVTWRDGPEYAHCADLHDFAKAGGQLEALVDAESRGELLQELEAFGKVQVRLPFSTMLRRCHRVRRRCHRVHL